VDAPGFLAVTVLFETAPSRSVSLQSMSRCVRSGHQVTCVVWDNSPQRAAPVELAWLREHLPESIYRHTPENVSLSRIYNTVIDEHLRSDNRAAFDAVLITDQDSVFDADLLDEASSAIAAHPDVSLFLPHVVSNDSIVSPATVYGCIGLPWRTKHVGRVSSRRTLAINSGMIIRSDYLARRFSGYDERLRFYGTDNDFCKKYSRDERWIYALNSVVTHSLARHTVETRDLRLWRHRENVQALLLTNSSDWFSRVTSKMYCAVYCSKTAILERDFRFLSWG
jgi:GT2 family glycosyltransferase